MHKEKIIGLLSYDICINKVQHSLEVVYVYTRLHNLQTKVVVFSLGGIYLIFFF